MFLSTTRIMMMMMIMQSGAAKDCEHAKWIPAPLATRRECKCFSFFGLHEGGRHSLRAIRWTLRHPKRFNDPKHTWARARERICTYNTYKCCLSAFSFLVAGSLYARLHNSPKHRIERIEKRTREGGEKEGRRRRITYTENKIKHCGSHSLSLSSLVVVYTHLFLALVFKLCRKRTKKHIRSKIALLTSYCAARTQLTTVTRMGIFSYMEWSTRKADAHDQNMT